MTASTAAPHQNPQERAALAQRALADALDPYPVGRSARSVKALDPATDQLVGSIRWPDGKLWIPRHPHDGGGYVVFTPTKVAAP